LRPGFNSHPLRQLFIEFCLKPVKRSVDRLFAFWGLISFKVILPHFAPFASEQFVPIPKAEKMLTGRTQPKAEKPDQGLTCAELA
jgi:hypothetical protein